VISGTGAKYEVTDLSGAKVSGGEPAVLSCPKTPVNGVLFGASLTDSARAGALARDSPEAAPAVGLVTTDRSRSLAGVAPRANAPFPFAKALESYLATRSGKVSVAVFDAKTGATYTYNPRTQQVTASIVKVAILGTLLRQAQGARRSLTSTERSLATRMIEQSDNSAATALWNEVGRGTGLSTFLRKAGMRSTNPDPAGYWGLMSTTAPDQVRLVRQVAYPSTALTGDSRTFAESLMRGVTPSQKWGVSGGVPASATVGLKNGWLPRAGGWVINSIGHVSGGPRDYVIAVLTSGNPSDGYGMTTVSQVSSMVWRGLASTPLGDFDGDGLSDLIVPQTSTDSLFLYPGNGRGFDGRSRIGAGWNGMSAITRLGDFDRDGHEDVIARERATGALWLYRGTGARFARPLKLGMGWNDRREITPVGDLNGDGFPDLLAIQTSTGSLFLYPGHATSLATPRLIAGGWGSMSELAGVGDFNRDGHVDLVARNSANGDLWLYRGTGTGLGGRVQLGAGWSDMRDLVGIGDFDQDGFNDLTAVQSATGKMFRYPGQGTSLGRSSYIGRDWTTDQGPVL
jgi:hypothetical protein